MFTPQEVASTTFPKSGFGSAGYRMSSVDDFLDKLTEDYKALYAENITLKAKLKVLAEKADEYRRTEVAMRTTLVNAQQSADVMLREAEAKKAAVVEEAAREAKEKVAIIESEIRDAEARLEKAKSELNSYVAEGTRLLEKQMAVLKEIPVSEVKDSAPVTEKFVKEEPVEEELSALQEESTDATAIFSSPFVERMEEARDFFSQRVEEKAVVEDISQSVEEFMEQKPSQEEKKDGPGEFTKSLEELQWQFGRNFDITKD